MNADIDYLGILKLLRALVERGVISEVERRKLAVRVAAQTGAEIIVLS